MSHQIKRFNTTEPSAVEDHFKHEAQQKQRMKIKEAKRWQWKEESTDTTNDASAGKSFLFTVLGRGLWPATNNPPFLLDSLCSGKMINIDWQWASARLLMWPKPVMWVVVIQDYIALLKPLDRWFWEDQRKSLQNLKHQLMYLFLGSLLTFPDNWIRLVSFQSLFPSCLSLVTLLSPLLICSH